MHALLASPLRYPGMPADRLWEMEDAQVNLGLVESEPWDLARLLVAEFALTYGNDWLVVPVDVPFGSLTTVESVIYTTTFGEHFVVQPTAEVSPDGQWRMFTITTPPAPPVDGLLVPPGAVAVQDGPPVEEVLFLRDEMANHGVGRRTQRSGPERGGARPRSRAGRTRVRSDPGPVAPAPNSTTSCRPACPHAGYPICRSSGYRAIQLVQGRMPDAAGEPVTPTGRLLNRAGVQTINDAEIPREGVVVRGGRLSPGARTGATCAGRHDGSAWGAERVPASSRSTPRSRESHARTLDAVAVQLFPGGSAVRDIRAEDDRGDVRGDEDGWVGAERAGRGVHQVCGVVDVVESEHVAEFVREGPFRRTRGDDDARFLGGALRVPIAAGTKSPTSATTTSVPSGVTPNPRSSDRASSCRPTISELGWSSNPQYSVRNWARSASGSSVTSSLDTSRTSRP